ncbi:hypothetical protein E4634_19765 [Mangrovimicrobium sediminis]|uniref:Uncharacterized protein n=1 Tax=Mangrovimicrobium sediminis TaxID=2562682 RepID=A0A4Z0LVK4_9GAMM|nr:hypothetical protein [Haliea sp. SAOS-164]TGD71085.1 hypothetical protein E4634_19765 [Haliea sp. SAOS-164]
MPAGKQRFILKASVTFIILVGLISLAGISVNATTTRFGNIGWAFWLPGLFLLIAGIVATWGSATSLLDARALRAHRANPLDTFSDGQTLALTGQVIVDGDVPTAPYSGTPCAAYSYQVSGQRRGAGSSSSDYRQQLCLLGYRLANAALDTGARRFPLLAIPDVDDEFRATSLGGEWGDAALVHIRSAAEAWTSNSEAEARGALEDARRNTIAPQSADLFVVSTATGANQISILEDTLPVATTITILGTYASGSEGLDGRRIGGMKAFPGDIDERLQVLDLEWRKGLKVGLPLLAVGLALLTPAWWWPA